MDRYVTIRRGVNKMKTVDLKSDGFRKRLHDTYLKSDITQVELSKKIGCNRKTLCNWLYNDERESVIILKKLCEALNVSADYLLFGEKK